MSGGAGPPPSVCPLPENAPEDEEELDDVACFLRVLSSALQSMFNDQTNTQCNQSWTYDLSAPLT